MQIIQNEVIDDLEDQRIRAEHARCATDNANSLSLLMQQYNLLIPARSIHLWRPTKRVFGAIDGIRYRIEIIATDGILGWFVTEDDQAWCGHIQCFDGKIEPLHSFEGPMTSKSKVKQPKKKSKRQTLIDSL